MTKSKKTSLVTFVLALINTFPVFASEAERYDINKEIAEREALGAESANINWKYIKRLEKRK